MADETLVDVFWKIMENCWQTVEPYSVSFPIPSGRFNSRFCLRKVKGSGETAHGAALGNSENNIQMTYGKTSGIVKRKLDFRSEKDR